MFVFVDLCLEFPNLVTSTFRSAVQYFSLVKAQRRLVRFRSSQLVDVQTIFRAFTTKLIKIGRI